eukprot:9363346-Pyramimonas_sp.AAC.1
MSETCSTHVLNMCFPQSELASVGVLADLRVSEVCRRFGSRARVPGCPGARVRRRFGSRARVP